jgi:nucleoside diphosphate kinase
MNALDGCTALGLTPDELDTQWGICKKAKKLVKFGGGFYCGLIEVKGKDPLYIFNGFFMSMRNKFTAPGLSIYYYVVEWEESKLSWADFRGTVLGPTDPVEAPPNSLRGQIFKGWKSLGLAAEPDVGDNGVHASASPFEALAELTNWVGASVEDMPFGRSLLHAGVSAATIKAWSIDPQVSVAGKKGSLFDSVEDMDSAACVVKLTAINAANGSAAAAPPSSIKFYLLAIGVIAGFTLNGLTMEKLSGKNAVFGGEKWEDSKSFIILAQSWFAVISSAIVLLIIGASGSGGKGKGGLVYSLTANVPISSWLVISLAFLGAHEFGYGALKYIPFPLQVLVKCCKPIPVMMGSVVLAGKKYSFEKYLSIFLLVAGVVVFMMFKPTDAKKGGGSGKAFELDDDTVMGLGMLGVGLLCDAIYGPMQDKVQAAVGDAPTCDAPACAAPTCDAPTCDTPTCDAPACDVPACDAPACAAPTSLEFSGSCNHVTLVKVPLPPGGGVGQVLPSSRALFVWVVFFSRAKVRAALELTRFGV